jgi:drug/metabolite transporter (DMT)-like permease
VTSALFGALAALSWGTHDFLARFPSRAVGPVATVFAVTASGLCLLTIWLWASGATPELQWASLWLVGVTGVFYALATLCLFAAFALGPISIVAPIAGSYPALAVLFALTQGARPSLMQWTAIAAVSVGVALVAQAGRAAETTGTIDSGDLPKILLLAFGASAGFAIGLTAGQAATPIFGETETAWMARIFGLAVVSLIWLIPRPRSIPVRWVPVLTLMGGLDVTALLLIVTAGNLPDATLATVASSGFGAVAVILARLFLKEPISLIQLIGIAFVFGGVVILAALG